MRDIHRIGGGGVENLKLKPAEARLDRPGISVLKAATPADAARQIREAFPTATGPHELAGTVGSSSEALIRGVGFDVLPDRTRKLPNHRRIVHPDGVGGFSGENLRRLSDVFVDSTVT